jgi:radical SAM protein with 4Fe4S-binding SPASM domain
VNFIKIRNELGAATRVRLQMIVQDENDTEQADFIEHWKQHLTAGDCVAAMRAHNWGGVVSVKKLERDRFINSLPCTSLWSNAMIHADGKMAMCSVDTEQTSNYAVGDVNLNSIAEIWNGESIKAMRLKHIESKREQHKLCNGCTTYRPNTKEYFLPL